MLPGGSWTSFRACGRSWNATMCRGWRTGRTWSTGRSPSSPATPAEGTLRRRSEQGGDLGQRLEPRPEALRDEAVAARIVVATGPLRDLAVGEEELGRALGRERPHLVRQVDVRDPALR